MITVKVTYLELIRIWKYVSKEISYFYQTSKSCRLDLSNLIM